MKTAKGKHFAQRVLGKTVPVVSAAAFFLALLGAQAGAWAQKPQSAVQASGSPWWKHALLYEVYPRSFQDTNRDGIGDLNGIAERLGYLQRLGVNAIWIAPIYPSPQVDFGYDISNYKAIDPMYGTMADFDRLLAQAKQHHIRILMDMVLNHTSDQDPWFIESRSSRHNPKRDWYIWRNGKGPGIPPNNWQSVFGGSAWTYDKKTGQWYYHKFYRQQPDLNWRNPAVEKAMFNICRFWLNKGVAGFRLDAVSTLFEDPKLRNEKVLPGVNEFGEPNLDQSLTEGLPQVHDVMRALRKVVDSYPGNRVMVAETYPPNLQALQAWYGKNNDEVQLPMDMRVGMINKLSVVDFRREINMAEHDLNGYEPLFAFDNHDNPRSWDRYGDGVHNLAIARVIAAILLETRSTALLYYGQEIGMKTNPPKRIEDVRDPVAKKYWPKVKGRDGERTPMQWTPGPNAGFTTAGVTPWLPLIPPSYKTENVEVESRQPESLLNWYKKLITLRATVPSLVSGKLTMVNAADDNVLAWVRQRPGHPAVLVACNFTARAIDDRFDLAAQGVKNSALKTLAVSPGAEAPSTEKVHLPPYGVYIGEVR